MKCPECGINHYSETKAWHCLKKLENLYAHYIILCYNNPGGVSEEYLLKNFKETFNVDFFRETQEKYFKMKEYYKKYES